MKVPAAIAIGLAEGIVVSAVIWLIVWIWPNFDGWEHDRRSREPGKKPESD